MMIAISEKADLDLEN